MNQEEFKLLESFEFDHRTVSFLIKEAVTKFKNHNEVRTYVLGVLGLMEELKVSSL